MTEHLREPGSKGVQPGDGYRVEIASLRRILKPLEESVTAARKIKNDWKPMAEHINLAATMDIVTPAEDVLSKWGFGMGRVAEHTDTVVDTLQEVIAAYMLADLLRVKDFAPTADNIAKLPSGDVGQWAWDHGARPKFDPPPKIWQEPWLDDDGTTVTGDVPTNPRQRVDGTWEVDGGGGGTIA
ncbi:hypothetical protein OIE63_15350 [Streptomyces sp. NBC_01795]|uniref:hypothetical protein n=1 Tax=Streptomyces sp. NBC_01795 TaxID=2975943 RepID=UPI002DDBEDE2|nr:hypothetical protein [Streptomyces sp. NBC_01795]WSA92786.1 hypothetical protein OIE63_15350 [Streptomyces sp. NBC_01795]